LPNPPLTAAEWRARYLRQALWTKELRDTIFRRAGLGRMRRVLDVGCGPGVLTQEIHRRSTAWVCGLDIQPAFFPLARQGDPASAWAAGDALALPFRNASFDLTYCHFTLLWVRDPAQALAEMRRVTQPGGWVLALAEPDYGGRIDYPAQLAEIGRLQSRALIEQGADPLLGRRLGELFHQAGLSAVETGLLGGQWGQPPNPDDWESEWQVLQADLQDRISRDELLSLKGLDAAAWLRGERVLFVPTFYAWGRVPG
jgi:SAM-dependent methyltransferase